MGFLGIGNKKDGAAPAANDGQAKKDSLLAGIFGKFKKKDGGGASAQSSSPSYGGGNAAGSSQLGVTVNGQYYYSGGFLKVGVSCEVCKKPAESMFKFKGGAPHYACNRQKCMHTACSAAIKEYNPNAAA